MTTTRIGLLQMTSLSDPARNILRVGDAVREAAARGCRYLQTPENTLVMGLEHEALRALAEPFSQTPAIAQFSEMAAKHQIWLHIGSLPVQAEQEPERLANRSLLFAPDGTLAAQYDKIHMFDVDLVGPGGKPESYRESATFRPGTNSVTAETTFAMIGLAVCYDLRFAALFRALAQSGATLLTVPAAFTRITGTAHWHVLLRARAIECGAFVAAAAQCGVHANGRATYGHSLIVDPWGTVLADGGDEPGLVTADLDFAAVAAARSRLPSLQHDRTWGSSPRLGAAL
jgi:deaminated glutathione amidase